MFVSKMAYGMLIDTCLLSTLCEVVFLIFESYLRNYGVDKLIFMTWTILAV